MAIRFDAAADRLRRTSGLLNYNQPYSVMGWFLLCADTNETVTFFELGDDDGENSDHAGCYSNGTGLECYVVVGGGWISQTGANLALNTWYHVAMVRESATSLKVYLNGVLALTNTMSVAGRSAASTVQDIGGAGTVYYRLDGRCAYLKKWSAALSPAEVQQEMLAIRPIRTGDLYAWLPAFPGAGERGRDYSGNGRNYTELGTLTDEDPPPVSWSCAVPFMPALPVPVQPAEARAGVFNPSASIGGPARVLPAPASAAGAVPDPAALLGSVSIAPAARTARARREGPNSDTTTLVQPGPCTARAGRSGPVWVFSSATVEPAPCLAKTSIVDPACIVAFLVRPDPCTAVADVVTPELFFSSCSMVPVFCLAATDAPPLVYRVLNVTVIAMTLCARPQDLTLGERRGVHLVERWDLEDGTGHWLFEDGSGIVLGMGIAGTKLNLWARSLELSLEGKD